MRVLVLGGDGFCGWPSALHLSRHGHDVTILDNLVRRRMDDELGVQSLTPIASLPERLRAWRETTGETIAHEDVDVAQDYDALLAVLDTVRPDAVVHVAEQRSAPYSMPEYLVFRIVRSSFTLAAVLSLRCDPIGPPWRR